MTESDDTPLLTLRRALVLGVIVAGGLTSLTLTACNTTEGVGEDIEALGDSIDDAAEDAND